MEFPEEIFEKAPNRKVLSELRNLAKGYRNLDYPEVALLSKGRFSSLMQIYAVSKKLKSKRDKKAKQLGERIEKALGASTDMKGQKGAKSDVSKERLTPQRKEREMGLGKEAPEGILGGKQSQALEEMKKVWKFTPGRTDRRALDKDYDRIARIVSKLDYTAKDVELFSLALVKFQRENDFPAKAGMFLSALINEGKDRDYVIHTSGLEKLPTLIGMNNTKNIVVEGKGGDWLGYGMKAGTITVNGDAGNAVGNLMKGGTITVNGNVERDVGGMGTMEGGTIIVKGYAEDWFEDSIKGGTIILHGRKYSF